MSDTIPKTGRFVWHEILTPDMDASREFLTTLFGWTPAEMDMNGEVYTMFTVGGAPAAGMYKIDPAKDGAPRWMSYATVEDVDAATKRVEGLGGKTLMEPHDIPGVGRCATITDSHGAMICPFTYAGDFPPEHEDAYTHGQFCWDELHTPDVETSKGFYGEMFGWKFTAMDMGELGSYWICNRGERGAAGMVTTPSGADGPSQWLPAVTVDDVDASTAKAAELGSKVWVQPSDIPGIGRFSVFSDPQGAMLCLFKFAKS